MLEASASSHKSNTSSTAALNKRRTKDAGKLLRPPSPFAFPAFRAHMLPALLLQRLLRKIPAHSWLHFMFFAAGLCTSHTGSEAARLRKFPCRMPPPAKAAFPAKEHRQNGRVCVAYAPVGRDVPECGGNRRGSSGLCHAVTGPSCRWRPQRHRSWCGGWSDRRRPSGRWRS